MVDLLENESAISEGEIIPARVINNKHTQIQKLGDLAPVTLRVSILLSSNSEIFFLLLIIQPMNSARETIKEHTSEIKVRTTSQPSKSSGWIAIPSPK